MRYVLATLIAMVAFPATAQVMGTCPEYDTLAANFRKDQDNVVETFSAEQTSKISDYLNSIPPETDIHPYRVLAVKIADEDDIMLITYLNKDDLKCEIDSLPKKIWESNMDHVFGGGL